MTKFPSFDDRRNLVSYSCSTPKITLETIYHSNASLYIGAKVLRAALLYNGNPHSCNDGLCIGTVPIMHAIFKVVRNNLYPPPHTHTQHTHNTHTHTFDYCIQQYRMWQVTPIYVLEIIDFMQSFTI